MTFPAPPKYLPCLVNVACERPPDSMVKLKSYSIFNNNFFIFFHSGWATEEEMNCHWVKLRSEIQGIQPPNMRSEDYFDAGAKYHVAANVGYVRYFTAFVYEFQFYRTLCLISKQYDPNDPKKPLHRCNFYGSKEAGDKLDSMLKLGSSKPWKDAMEVRFFILGIF